MGYDSGTDLAVLEVDTKRALTALKWADSKKLSLANGPLLLETLTGSAQHSLQALYLLQDVT